jgi:uncharacterized membrane protein YhaH (DUF805 family)
MDFNLTLDPTGLFAVPETLTEWLLTSIPVVLAVRMERLGLTLPRMAYLLSLVLRLIGMMLLGMFLVFVAGNVGAAMSEATGRSYLSQALLPIVTAGILLSAVTGVVMTRPVIWRLRDAGLDTRFAYLAAVPILGALMAIALIFYPPGKNAEPVAATE